MSKVVRVEILPISQTRACMSVLSIADGNLWWRGKIPPFRLLYGTFMTEGMAEKPTILARQKFAMAPP